RDRTIRPAASFVTILVERICDFVAVVLLFAVNLTWFAAPKDHETDFSHVRQIGLILLLGTLIGLASLFLFSRHAGFVIESLEKRIGSTGTQSQRIGRAFIKVLDQLCKALKVLASARAFITAALWTGLLWLAIVFGNLLVIRSFGVQF